MLLLKSVSGSSPVTAHGLDFLFLLLEWQSNYPQLLPCGLYFVSSSSQQHQNFVACSKDPS
jgi:hypothetical protein